MPSQSVDPRVRDLVVAMQQTFPPVDVTKSGTQVRAEVKAAGEKVIPRAPEAIAEVRDRTVPGPYGQIPIRIYRPEIVDELLPLVVFTHGGGWVVCDLDSHDGICRAVANASGCMVVAVDYRLAPEHKFPVAAEDAYAALCWLVDNAGDIGADPTRVAVLGDSAGGNLAAVLAMMARDRGAPALAAQVLVYPVIDYSTDRPSHHETGEGFSLSSEEVMYYWHEYLADPADGANPYASPIRAEDHSGLPRCLLVTAEFDPLRDEGEAYAERLSAAGVQVRQHRYDGMFHSFFSFLTVLHEAEDLRDEISDELRDAFGMPVRNRG